MSGLDNSDPLFNELNSIKDSLSKNNQNMVPIIVELFVEFQKTITHQLELKFNEAVERIKDECLQTCQAKDAKITALEGTCKRLQNKLDKYAERLDEEDAYIRRESLIVSGDFHPRSH